MADQALFDVLRAWDANGYAAPMATATFYASGTLTEIDVFVDASATTLATNPVPADGNGVFPQRYVSEDARAIVRDADGATLYDLDPVPTVKTDFGAASLIVFSPTVNIPSITVQAAIELVDTNARARDTAADAAKQPIDATLTSLSGLSLAAGDLIYATASDTLTRLGKGTTRQRFRMNAGATAPEWTSFWDYTSAGQTITVNTATTVSHGLGARPSHCMIKLVCTSTDAGYPVGAEIHMSSSIDGSGSGLTLWTPNATQISVCPGSFVVATNASGVAQNLDLTKWQAVFLANL